MEKLFDVNEFIQKDRPTKITDKQKEDLFVEIANEIIENQYSSDDLEDIIEDLQNLYFDQEGFEIAKDLERKYGEYKFSGDFIDFLGDISWKFNRVLNENIKLWVNCHKPEPKFETGTKLIVNENLTFKTKKGEFVFVTGLDKERANYYIHENPNNKGGYVIPYEKVELKCEIA